MSSIFLSYRRDDTSGYAGRLDDQLSAHFGREQIFRDIDTIPPGVDFVRAVESAIGSCRALVALIGRDWLSIQNAKGQRRLDDPDDLVRLEIEAALNKGVFVMPVLVEDARMPSPAELPDSLARLSTLNALELSDSRWEYDSRRLLERLEAVLGAPAPSSQQVTGQREGARPAPEPNGPRSPQPGGSRRAWTAAVIVVLLIGIALALRSDDTARDETAQNEASSNVDGTTSASGAATAATRPIGKKAAYGSFVFDFGEATYEPGPDGSDGKVVITATVENLAMRSLAPRPGGFLSSSGENYPLIGGSQPEIPAAAKGKATLEFAVQAFSFDDARLTLGDGDQNRSVIPLAGESGLVANLPEPLQLSGTLKAGTFTLQLEGGIVTAGPIGTLSDGRSLKKGQRMLTLFYDFTAGAGGNSSFPNRELSLRLPDGTSVTLGDFSDPIARPGNTLKDQFASFVVDDPPRGGYVLAFRNDPETTGELRFEVP